MSVSFSMYCQCSMQELETIKTHPNHNLLHHTSPRFHQHKQPTNSQATFAKFIPFSYYSFRNCGRFLSTCAYFHPIKGRIQLQQQYIHEFYLEHSFTVFPHLHGRVLNLVQNGESLCSTNTLSQLLSLKKTANAN